MNRLPYLETYPDMRRTKKGGRRFDELPFLHADRLEIGPRPLFRALPVMAGILCAPFRSVVLIGQSLTLDILDFHTLIVHFRLRSGRYLSVNSF